MRKIVLVMDNVIIAMMIRNNLVNNGYLVPFITNTLKEALDTDYEMELIIFDMDFISMDRLDEVRVPIIFLTSQSEWEISQEEHPPWRLPMISYYKPFTEEELLYKTRKILPPN